MGTIVERQAVHLRKKVCESAPKLTSGELRIHGKHIAMLVLQKSVEMKGETFLARCGKS